MSENICPFCMEVFWSTQGPRKKFCSVECQRAQRAPVTVIVCPTCDTEFVTAWRKGFRQPVVKYCSKICLYKSKSLGRKCNTLSIPNRAYLAGIIDGEGCIQLNYNHSVNIGVKVFVLNTHKGLIDWIRDTVGIGNLFTKISKSDKNKDQYTWTIIGPPSVAFLEQIMEFLIVKKAQALLALLTQEKLFNPAYADNRLWQKAHIDEMHRLNRRGPVLYVAPTLTAASVGSLPTPSAS